MEITTKANIGDKIYFLHNNKLVCEFVEEIHIKVYPIEDYSIDEEKTITSENRRGGIKIEYNIILFIVMMVVFELMKRMLKHQH